MEKLKSDSSSEGDARNNNFNFVRFCLASVVVFTHCFPLADGPTLKHPAGDTEREWLYFITNGQIFGGSVAVYFFFFLSGYLIVHSLWNSSHLFEYFYKRILRIYPAFLVTTLIGSLLVAPLTIGFATFFQKFKPLEFFPSILLLQNPDLFFTFPHNPYPGEENGSLWTIKYEAAMYILTGLLGFLGILKNKKTLFVVCLFFYVLFSVQSFAPELVYRYYGSIYPFGDTQDYPSLLSCFFTGIFFAGFENRIKFTRLGCLLAFLIIVVGGALGHLPFFLPLFGGYILLAYGKSNKYSLKFARKSDLSYGIYLNSFLIQQTLLHYFPKAFHRSPYLLFVFTFPATLFAAYLSWHFIEKQFLRLKPQGSKPRVSTAPAI